MKFTISQLFSLVITVFDQSLRQTSFFTLSKVRDGRSFFTL